ncbi:hypothetical protein TNCV_4491981 [Trichonephila clavipes]|nr:hypothetical protein TNCV_4491981 [Trichonephila clavipes]
MGAEILFMDDNARPSLCKHCRRMPSIRGYHPYGLVSILTDLNPIEHVWDMLGRPNYSCVNPSTPVCGLQRGYCLMSGVIFT